jgi:inosine/xanthosine triphosphate pyrophosphatase family protein
MTSKLTFVTGNAKKDEYYSKYIGIPLLHKKLDLEEIQSLDVCKVAEHKLEQAYTLLKEPVIIEDGSLEFEGLNGLPGPFIKFFLEALTSDGLCKLLNDKSHNAIVRSVIGYTDGVHTKIFETVSYGAITDRL